MPSIENYMRSEFYMNSLLMSQIELEENPKNISNTQLLDCENKLTIMEHENNVLKEFHKAFSVFGNKECFENFGKKCFILHMTFESGIWIEKALLKFVPKYIELKEIMSECIGYKMKKPEKVE
jgi:hypothetical protein